MAGCVSWAIAQLHIAAYGFQPQVARAFPARALEPTPRAVLACPLGTGIEAVGDIAAEARHLLGVTAVPAWPHAQVPAPRRSLECCAAGELALDAQIA